MGNFTTGLWWALKIGLFLFFIYSCIHLAPILIPIVLIVGGIWTLGWAVKKYNHTS